MEILHCGQYGVTCLIWLGTSYVATGSNDGLVRIWTVGLVNVSEHSEGTLKTFNLFLCRLIASTLFRLLWIIRLVFLMLKDFIKQSLLFEFHMIMGLSIMEAKSLPMLFLYELYLMLW
jgi:WD40 repeat protein